VTFLNHNPPDYDYEPATLEENLTSARAMLEQLDAEMFGPETAPLEAIREGACDDCDRHTEMRFHYGQFDLCRPCAALRQRARAKAA
jgi:hypothetical protein